MIRLLKRTTLDQKALFFASFETLVNSASYQQDGILTHGRYQYAAWYSHDRQAVIARRDVFRHADGSGWHSIKLPHRLSEDDSHRSISIGVSEGDGRLHLALDTHVSQIYYFRSITGLVDQRGDKHWRVASFGEACRTLHATDIGDITYPQFLTTPEGDLQLSFRTGTSVAGSTNLAEYKNGAWACLGPWSTPNGTYINEHGRSDSRSIYLHGIGYGPQGRLHASFTWREGVEGNILCHPGGLSNHDTGYVYSDDRGRTWSTQDGAVAAIIGSKRLLSIDTPDHVVAPTGVDCALMNQEAQAIDSTGRPHVIISYVPRRITDCVTDFAVDRRRWGRTFHLHRTDAGTWRETEIGERLKAFGRSRLVFDCHDNAYVVMPRGRVVTASASSGWTDWRLRFDAVALNGFGEVLVDGSRATSAGIFYVMYQQESTGSAHSPLCVLDVGVQGAL